MKTTKRIDVKSHTQHDQNPFTRKLIDELQANKYKKYRYATRTDRAAILTAINEDGEPIGHTTFVQTYEVDPEEFTKIYKRHLRTFIGLNVPGSKLFQYIQTLLKPGQDFIIFNTDRARDFTGYTSEKDLYIGLTELLRAEIIAKSIDTNIYYINPSMFFNGNRLTYVKNYIKKNPKNPDQLQFDQDQSEEHEEENTNESE